MVFGVTTVIRPAAARPRAAIGGLLRSWRQTRRVSQLELSSVSGVSSRHNAVGNGPFPETVDVGLLFGVRD